MLPEPEPGPCKSRVQAGQRDNDFQLLTFLTARSRRARAGAAVHSAGCPSEIKELVEDRGASVSAALGSDPIATKIQSRALAVSRFIPHA